MLIGLFLILALHTIVEGVSLHPHLLRPTSIPCERTEDCLAYFDYTWCHRGVLCLNYICQEVPDFPCASTEWCDEREKRCLPHNCTSWRDCDDGLYCNGAERCIDSHCVSDPRLDCSPPGICSEETQQCSYPVSLVKERERLRILREAAISAVAIVVEKKIKTETLVKAKTLDVGSISNAALALIILIVGTLVAVAVFCLVVVQVTRRTPPSILIDRSTGGTGGIYLPEVHY